ncbi:unnamed protein product [Cylicocyclus nassatus]|uniref:Uncharacterized protein n=1 Tax=Cylicocyclus nassatus TaxID=53992 RepID=A0AA36M3L2_CYLNA|nr:unnamed protein product [Cylicocyclus nassatus]
MWPIAFLLLLLCSNADARPIGSVRNRINIRTRSPDGRTQSPDMVNRPSIFEYPDPVYSPTVFKYDRKSTQEEQGFLKCIKRCWEGREEITNMCNCIAKRCIGKRNEKHTHQA